MRPEAIILKLTLSTCLFLCFFVCFAQTSAWAASKNDKQSEALTESSSNKEFAEVTNKLEKLVKAFFPRAKFKSSKDAIHFEFKVKKYVAGTGSSRRILAPNVNGIVGDIKVRSGDYDGDEVLPYKVNEMYWVSLKLAPYSELCDSHLDTLLLYPPQTPIDFVNDFIKIVQSYKEDKIESSATEVKKEPEPKSEPEPDSVVEIDEDSKQAEISSDEADADEKFDFGAPKFSSYSFSEGRFKIKLPGAPVSKATNRGGMRFVDFKYVEAQGLYNMGYAIMPGSVPYSEQQRFLGTMAESLIKASGGKVESHHSLKWQGFPGRQIKVKNLAGKKSKSSLFRIFLVRRYFYILQAAGTNEWLASEAVKTVLNSLIVRPELTASERAKLRRYNINRTSSSSSYSYRKRRSRNKRSKYNHRLEKIRADRKYNRIR